MVKAYGSFVRNPNIDRVRDLDEIRALLEGAFDSINGGQSQRELGSACGDQSRLPVPLAPSATGLGDCRQGDQFGEDVSTARSTAFADKKIEYIFCCDATIGIQSATSTLPTYVRRHQEETGYPVALSVQNTPERQPSAPMRRRRSCRTPA